MVRIPPLVILLFFIFTSKAQQFADKKFYLVDSLHLVKLENYDLLLLDSVLNLYHKEKSDTAKLIHINNLVENLEDEQAWMPYNRFMLFKASSALESGSLNKSETRFYKTLLAGVYNNFGYSLNQQGNKEGALDYFKKSMILLEELNNKQGLSDVYNNIGLIYKNAGQVTKCLEYYFKCLKICEAINDTKGKASSLNNIGMMYKELEDYNKALEYLLNALKEWEKLDNKRGMSSTLGNLGLLYSKVGKPELSLEYYFKALILNERTGDKEGIGTELGNIGWVYFEEGKYEKALDYFERSLQYRKLVNDNAGIGYGLVNLGSVYKKTGNEELALKYGLQALETGKKLGYPDLIRRAAILLYGIYKQKNKPAEALAMHELYIQMRDSTVSDQAKKAGLKKQYQYEFELKEKELKSEQEKREILYNDEIKRQKIIFNASLIGGIIFLIFSIVLYKRFMLTRKQKAIIEVQKVEMDKAFTALHEKNKEVMDSIYYARRIQNALLTSEGYINTHFKKEHFVLYKPKDIVSGDFYWGTSVASAELGTRSKKNTSDSKSAGHPELTGEQNAPQLTHNTKVAGRPEPADENSGLFYLAVCDSTGHGVPGAFMSLLNIGFLSEAINEKFYREPDKVFNYARKRLIDNVNKEGQKDGFDGALFCFDVSPAPALKFTYAAANCKPVIIRNGEVIYLEGDRMPVGMGEKQDDFRMFEFIAEKNDMLYIFTDGFADQFGGPSGKKFKYKPLVQLLSGISTKPINEQQQYLSDVFDSWKGALEQVDDVCIIGVRL